jgi:membrane-bound lytic murein transglycosylase A
MFRIATRLWTAAFVALMLAGCEKPPTALLPYEPPKKDYNKALPPGSLALRKIGPERYPDFGLGFAERAGLREAVLHSIQYMSKPSSQKYYPYGDITHARALASLYRFLEVIDSAPSAEALNQTIRNEFDVYESVGCDDAGTVYFTGYYTPIFEGRKQPDARFRYPLYGLPPDLVKDEEGQTLGRRLPDGTVAPSYPTRRQIEEGRLLDGYEVAWVSSPFEAYVITVQGSAKLRLADGTLYELGYAGNNGHEYTPISEAMIRDGVIRREDLSLQTLLQYFRQHPEQVYHYAWKNARYVFFKEAPGGPYGSIGVPVTPFRSLATDKQVFPRACVAFVTTTVPQSYGGSITQRPFNSFALDQDTGGAIRAAGRCDIFLGIGPGAEALAGRTGAEGHLYYIFVKQ